MTDSPIISLERFAAGRYGLFTRAQARTAGATDRVLAHRVATAQWERILPTVYRVAAVTPTFRQRAFAGTLWSAGLVSHTAAARLWALEGINHVEIHVTVARSRGLRHDDVIVHRTDDVIAADRRIAHGIATTSALRTVLDLAQLLDAPALEIAIEDALRRGLFSTGQLRWRAAQRCSPGVDGAATLGRLLQQQQLGKTDSGWELRVARILTDAGYPEPLRQLEIQTIDGRRTVDLAYPGLRSSCSSTTAISGTRGSDADTPTRNDAMRFAFPVAW